MKDFIIAGNWKMNKTVEEGIKLFNDIVELKGSAKIQNTKIILAVPFMHLVSIKNLVKDSGIYLSAQDCHHHEFGPFTGETSASMIKNAGIDYIIIGHSERRVFDTDDIVNAKVKTVIANRLKLILCIGEKEPARNFNVHEDIIRTQIDKAFEGIDLSKVIKNVIIAYEPVWAIGTGNAASNLDAREMASYIKKHINKNYFIDEEDINVIYGGSLNTKNAGAFIAEKDLDGLLIGGSSLVAEDFVDIIKQSQNR